MILGRVSPEGEPTITVSLAGRDWEAIIDTGLDLMETWSYPLACKTRSTLGMWAA